VQYRFYDEDQNLYEGSSVLDSKVSADGELELQPYSIGEMMNVYYDSKSPENNALDPQKDLGIYAFGWGLMLLGFIAELFLGRKGKE
jgi:hypothetical protein